VIWFSKTKRLNSVNREWLQYLNSPAKLITCIMVLLQLINLLSTKILHLHKALTIRLSQLILSNNTLNRG
jgi:hypothetical protein